VHVSVRVEPSFISCLIYYFGEYLEFVSLNRNLILQIRTK
jgi:hypothetical protein